VRGNIIDEPTHIHFDTGNNQYFNQFIGDDNKYIQLANTGNIVINTNNYAGNSAQWNFDYNGTTQFPNNILAAPDGNTLVIKTTSGNVYSTLNTGALGGYTSIGIQDNTTGAYQAWAYVKTEMANVNTPSAKVVVVPGNTGAEVTWTFDAVGNLTVPGTVTAAAGETLILQAAPGQNADLMSNNGNNVVYVNDTAAYVQTVDGGANVSVWTFDTAGDLGAPGNVSAVGNITGVYILGNGSQLTGLPATYGNANVATFLAAFGSNTIVTTGNITGGNLITAGSGGAITMTGGNITGAGNIAAGNVSTTGNVTAANFFGNGATLSNVATTFESFWTVPVGNSTQSFTVSPNNTYYLWVDSNIANGIITWNATATVTNTNVPVVGAQYAWVYSGGGTPIDFTSIPNQFVGTSNTIVRSSTAPSATTNRFDFGINNTSGGNVTVRYGWAQIS